MKRLCSLIFMLALAVPAFSQGKAAQIADLKDQLNNVQQNYPPMEKRYDALDTKKGEIKYAVEVYNKYNDQYKTDVDSFNQKQSDVNRQQQLLNPSIQNYMERKQQHDGNRCTYTEGTNTCDWYNREADQLNANRAQLAAAQAAITAQQGPLDAQKSNLDQTKSKLDQIYQNNQTNIDKWKADMTQLKADYDANLAREKAILAQLAVLYGSVNSCLQEIPAACQQPAIGPDGKPVLDQNCEIMKRQCSNMFDGSK
jgi:chromosome segregation ATPase